MNPPRVLSTPQGDRVPKVLLRQLKWRNREGEQRKNEREGNQHWPVALHLGLVRHSERGPEEGDGSTSSK